MLQNYQPNALVTVQTMWAPGHPTGRRMYGRNIARRCRLLQNKHKVSNRADTATGMLRARGRAGRGGAGRDGAGREGRGGCSGSGGSRGVGGGGGCSGRCLLLPQVLLLLVQGYHYVFSRPGASGPMADHGGPGTYIFIIQ